MSKIEDSVEWQILKSEVLRDVKDDEEGKAIKELLDMGLGRMSIGIFVIELIRLFGIEEEHAKDAGAALFMLMEKEPDLTQLFLFIMTDAFLVKKKGGGDDKQVD